MFERLSEPARGVLVEAQELAVELGSPGIEAAHLLHGCVVIRDDAAGRPLRDLGVTEATVRRHLHPGPAVGSDQVDPELLRAIGVDYDGVRAAVEETFGAGALDRAVDRRATSRAARPHFSVDAKRAIEQALRVTQELGVRRIRPGHLLLGILRLNDGVVSAILADAGTSVAALSATVLAELAQAA